MTVTYTKTITFRIEYEKGQDNRVASIVESLKQSGCTLVSIQQEIDKIDGKPHIIFPKRVEE